MHLKVSNVKLPKTWTEFMRRGTSIKSMPFPSGNSIDCRTEWFLRNQ